MRSEQGPRRITRSATKGERKFTSIWDRWQNDDAYRTSQLAHNWSDVKASVFCNVSARSGHFVNMDVIFLPSVCDSFCVSTFSLGQGCRSFCHELYEQSIHGRVLQEWTRCVFYSCLYSLCRPCFLVSLVPLARIQQFCPLSGLHANIVEEYVLLSALLHDQSCLQSSPFFQHQFVWLPFSRKLVCKGGCFFHVRGSTRVVSSSLCYVAVSRARENNWDKPLLDVIIIDCLCHYH